MDPVKAIEEAMAVRVIGEFGGLPKVGADPPQGKWTLPPKRSIRGAGGQAPAQCAPWLGLAGKH